MTEYSLAPGFIKLRYTTPISGLHVATLSVLPAVTPSTGVMPVLATRGATQIDADEAMEAYAGVLRLAFNAAATIDSWEFWSKPTDEDDPIFIFGAPIGLDGTAAGGTVEYSQAIWSFRTFGGHIAKFYAMETAYNPNARVTIDPLANTPIGEVGEYLLSDECVFVGRDNTFMLFPLWFTTKTNDALRKRAILNS